MPSNTCVCAIGARVPDACTFKRATECIDDARCIWEPPDERFREITEMLSDRMKTTICPSISNAVVSARESNTLESLLSSDELCLSFCDRQMKSDCEGLLGLNSTAASQNAVIRHPLLLRKLQQVFQSGRHLFVKDGWLLKELTMFRRSVRDASSIGFRFVSGGNGYGVHGTPSDMRDLYGLFR